MQDTDRRKERDWQINMKYLHAQWFAVREGAVSNGKAGIKFMLRPREDRNDIPFAVCHKHPRLTSLRVLEDKSMRERLLRY